MNVVSASALFTHKLQPPPILRHHWFLRHSLVSQWAIHFILVIVYKPGNIIEEAEPYSRTVSYLASYNVSLLLMSHTNPVMPYTFIIVSNSALIIAIMVHTENYWGQFHLQKRWHAYLYTPLPPHFAYISNPHTTIWIKFELGNSLMFKIRPPYFDFSWPHIANSHPFHPLL